MTEKPSLADIQGAFFEYTANFKEPIVSLWYGNRQGDLINAVLKALSQWQVKLENVTWNQGAKNLREIQLTFGVPSLAASVQVSIGGLTLSCFNPAWDVAPALVSLFQTTLDSIRTAVSQDLESQHATLGLHVKPTSKPFKQVLARFVNAQAIGAEDAAMYGFSVYSPGYSFVVDSSAIVAGGVFIKLIRGFPADKPFAEMAATLRKDEETVLNMLGLKLE